MKGKLRALSGPCALKGRRLLRKRPTRRRERSALFSSTGRGKKREVGEKRKQTYVLRKMREIQNFGEGRNLPLLLKDPPRLSVSGRHFISRRPEEEGGLD